MNARAVKTLLVAALAALWISCGSDADDAPAGQVQDIVLSAVRPATVVPGSRLVVEGSFGDVQQPFVQLEGSFEGASVDLLLTAEMVGLGRLEVLWPGGAAAGLPANDGKLAGTIRVTATGPVDGREHLSQRMPLELTVASSLQPSLYAAVEDPIIYVNDALAVAGDGFLLGGDEGTTVAIVEGCFTKQGETTCTPVPDTTIPLSPNPLQSDPVVMRREATFPFVPAIAGIEPGYFQGTVRLRNDHELSGSSAETNQIAIELQLEPTRLDGFSPGRASLGQFVDIAGRGFVGKWKNIDDPAPAATTIELAGTFTPTGAPGGSPVLVTLVAEFVSGARVRYVLNEEDELGSLADLRTVTGDFKGSATAITKYGGKTVQSDVVQVSLGIDAVKQVVWLNYLPTYKDSLEHLGLRAADQRIRDRVVEVMRRDYAGVNVEFRSEEPSDFALFARVDLAGPDPNALGLLGYDNSPGKDKGNSRLYDKIGGVNALTQEDNYPGYGGVFVESLFGFSEHPGSFAEKLDVADPLFDEIFDPFRPDRSGKPVQPSELEANVPILSDSSGCPAPKSNRPMRIACAVWVLGSMIGTTTGHEVAHSLGLADPQGEEFHNPGDEPNRIMDSGGARTFRERSELGDGPGVFCDEDYAYLRQILPTGQPDPLPGRPTCY